jgi:hypothetical protein
MTEQTREERTTTNTAAPPSRLSNLLFDLRTIVATLFAIYGIVCVVWGAAFDSAADSRRSGGIAVNLWAGIGMLVAAAAFFAWSWLRPLPVEDVETDAADGDADER